MGSCSWSGLRNRILLDIIDFKTTTLIIGQGSWVIPVAGVQPDVIYGSNRPCVTYYKFEGWSAQPLAVVRPEQTEAQDFHVSIAINKFTVADFFSIQNQHHSGDRVRSEVFVPAFRAPLGACIPIPRTADFLIKAFIHGPVGRIDDTQAKAHSWGDGN